MSHTETTPRSEMWRAEITQACCTSTVDQDVTAGCGDYIGTAMWYSGVTPPGCCWHFISATGPVISQL